MNKFTSLGIMLFILSIQTSLFSQSKSDLIKSEKIAESTTLPTSDQNTTAQSSATDLELRLYKAKAELDAMVKFNENPSPALVAQISEYRLIVAKLEKALGIN